MSRIIPGAIKDENGIYIKTISKTISEKIEEVSAEVKVEDLSLDDFLGKYLQILHRETRNLMIESSSGKLSKDSSQCMRDNLKLIMELKKQEKTLLDSLSDEELKKLSKRHK